MGLVEYSDSDSETESRRETNATSKQAAAGGAKKPFQKIVDRSKPGKILVNLPTSTADDKPGGDEPPAKRVKTEGGGRFSGFSSFLPPPKASGKPPPPANKSATGSASRPGIHLKTGTEPAFQRQNYGEMGEEEEEGGGSASGTGSGLNLPPPKASFHASGPSIVPGQKPAEEVKLVGKPLMFKPLSVARKPGQKKAATGLSAAQKKVQVEKKTAEAAEAGGGNERAAPKQKISLFSLSDDSTAAESTTVDSGTYEPMFGGDHDSGDIPSRQDATSYDGYDGYADGISAPTGHPTSGRPPPQQASLDAVVNDLNLSAAARRELFGRGGAPTSAAAATKVVSFDMEQEYEHNQALRAAGEQQTYNPVRAIATGKHNLRQIVNAVQNQTAALEESFAQNRSTRREAAGRYGWK